MTWAVPYCHVFWIDVGTWSVVYGRCFRFGDGIFIIFCCFTKAASTGLVWRVGILQTSRRWFAVLNSGVLVCCVLYASVFTPCLSRKMTWYNFIRTVKRKVFAWVPAYARSWPLYIRFNSIRRSRKWLRKHEISLLMLIPRRIFEHTRLNHGNYSYFSGGWSVRSRP